MCRWAIWAIWIIMWSLMSTVAISNIWPWLAGVHVKDVIEQLEMRDPVGIACRTVQVNKQARLVDNTRGCLLSWLRLVELDVFKSRPNINVELMARWFQCDDAHSWGRPQTLRVSIDFKKKNSTPTLTSCFAVPSHVIYGRSHGWWSSFSMSPCPYSRLLSVV